MRYLVDTHILIWAVTDASKLSARARKVLADKSGEYFFSAASVWEIAIKHARHPDDIPLSAAVSRRMFLASGFQELPVLSKHAEHVESLPAVHADPFDRLLIAQAQVERMRFVSHDRKIPAYGDFVVAV